MKKRDEQLPIFLNQKKFIAVRTKFFNFGMRPRVQSSSPPLLQIPRKSSSFPCQVINNKLIAIYYSIKNEIYQVNKMQSVAVVK